jgi:hypothetical protein
MPKAVGVAPVTHCQNGCSNPVVRRLRHRLARRDEGRHVARLDEEDADDDDDDADRDLDEDEQVGDELGLLDAGCGDRTQDESDAQGADVDRCILAEQARRQTEGLLQIARPAACDHGCAEGEFEHQVPRDDPREDLADRRVGVGVGAACGRHGSGQLGITERGQEAHDTGDEEAQHDAGAGEVLGADTGQREDARADDDPDAEAHEVLAVRFLLRPECSLSTESFWCRTVSTSLVRTMLPEACCVGSVIPATRELLWRRRAPRTDPIDQ